MKTRTSWIVAASLALTVPVWANCGSCGSGGHKDKGGHDHAHAHGHSHAHAEIGKPAPDFTLEDLSGKTHKLSAYKGKIVVLEWISHACPVVNRCHSSKIMAKTAAKFEGKPVVWLAIDSSHFAEQKATESRGWAKKQGIEYPVLLDASGKVGHLYAAKTTPHMFVIDKNGVLAYTGAIDDDPYGKKSDRRNYVEDAVTSLLQGSAVATAKTKSYGCSVKYGS
jgi:peroxiredoxin